MMPSQEIGFHEATQIILLDAFEWRGEIDEGAVAEPFAWLITILLPARTARSQ